MIEKKHYVETFLLVGRDLVPIEKEYIFKIIDLIDIYKYLASYLEMEEEWEYTFYEEYVNLMNDCFNFIRPNILKVFNIDLFSSGHLSCKNIKNVYDLNCLSDLKEVIDEYLFNFDMFDINCHDDIIKLTLFICKEELGLNHKYGLYNNIIILLEIFNREIEEGLIHYPNSNDIIEDLFKIN